MVTMSSRKAISSAFRPAMRSAPWLIWPGRLRTAGMLREITCSVTNCLLLLSLVAAIAGSCFAGPAGAASPGRFGMMPAVTAAVQAHELTLAKASPLHSRVECVTVISRQQTLYCSTFTTTPNPAGKMLMVVSGPRWQSRVVAAFVECGGAQDDRCSARPVCTYRVSVSAGSTLGLISTAVVNVCRKGWVRSLG